MGEHTTNINGVDYVACWVAAAETRAATAELRAHVARLAKHKTMMIAVADEKDAIIRDRDATIADLRAKLASIRTAADAQRVRERGEGRTTVSDGVEVFGRLGYGYQMRRADWYGSFTHPPEPAYRVSTRFGECIGDDPLFGSDVDA